MKKIMCDTCNGEEAKSFMYVVGKSMDPSGNGYQTEYKYVDLCFNCVQDFVLKHRLKLIEVIDSGAGLSAKRVIHG
jgi:hypothetical protein